MRIRFFFTFWRISHFLFIFRGFRRKLDIFGKKSGGTPNPGVKKLGVTPNPHQFIASAGARAAEAELGAKRHGPYLLNPF